MSDEQNEQKGRAEGGGRTLKTEERADVSLIAKEVGRSISPTGGWLDGM
jgi:hypothetical protein